MKGRELDPPLGRYEFAVNSYPTRRSDGGKTFSVGIRIRRRAATCDIGSQKTAAANPDPDTLELDSSRRLEIAGQTVGG